MPQSHCCHFSATDVRRSASSAAPHIYTWYKYLCTHTYTLSTPPGPSIISADCLTHTTTMASASTKGWEIWDGTRKVTEKHWWLLSSPSLIKHVGHCIMELKDFGSCALLKPKWDQWWVACFWQTGLLGVIARCGLWEQNQASCAPKGGLRDGSFWASELPQRGISIQCHCLQLRSLQLQWNSLFHLWQKSQTWEALLTKTMPNEGSSFYSCSR